MPLIELIKQLQQINAIKFGTFTLKSGLISPVYIDLRCIISYPQILQALAEQMWEQVKHLKADLICGVPYTALPIATAISLQHNKPMVMVRKEAKDYGTKKLVEGNFEPGQSCMIIEDVVTTGSSILTTVEELKKVGLVVKYVVSFVDREQGGKENLTKAGCEFFSVCTLTEILSHQNHAMV
jgi:uridine monophosphate synthetase